MNEDKKIAKKAKSDTALAAAKETMDLTLTKGGGKGIDANDAMQGTVDTLRSAMQIKSLELTGRVMENLIKDADEKSEDKTNSIKPKMNETDKAPIVQLVQSLDPETQRAVMQDLIRDRPEELYALLGARGKGNMLGLAQQRQVQQPVSSPASELKTLAEAMGITAENRTNNESSSMQNFLTMLQVIKELQTVPAPQPVQVTPNPQNDAMLALIAKMGDAVMESNKQTKEMVVAFQAKLAAPAPVQENSAADKYLQMAMDAQKAIELEKDKRHQDQLDNILQRQAERDAAYQKQLENISKVSTAGLDNRGSFQQMMEEFRKMQEMGKSISGETNVEIEKAKIEAQTKKELAEIELKKMQLTIGQTNNEKAQKIAARGAFEGTISKLADAFLNPPATQSLEPATINNANPISKNILSARSA
jgi:hypothetical protein